MFNFVRQYPNWLFPASSQYNESTPDNELPQIRTLTPYLPHTWLKTLKAINSYNPDLVIVSFWIPFFAPAFGWIIRRIKSARIIILAHNIEFHEKWFFAKPLTRYLLTPAHRIVLLSEKSSHDLFRLYPEIPKYRIVSGFHPIYEHFAGQHFSRLHPVEKQTLLFFGLIKDYKGLDVLLDALPIVREQYLDIKLILAGDVYGSFSPYQDQINRYNLEPSLEKHLTYIPDQRIKEFFQRSVVCILPYVSATQSGIISMSYAFNLPVIASRVGGIGEYVREGDQATGILVDPGNPQALATAILSYLNNGLYQNFSNNIDLLKQNLTWEKLSQKIMDSL